MGFDTLFDDLFDNLIDENEPLDDQQLKVISLYALYLGARCVKKIKGISIDPLSGQVTLEREGEIK